MGKIKLIFISVLIFINLETLASTKDRSGYYGFNWLSNPNTKCQSYKTLKKKIEDKKVKCVEEQDGSHEGNAWKLLKCRVSNKEEWLLYSSKKLCVNAYETIQANAP